MPTRDELYLAYRQAKAALFFERRGVGLLGPARFERDLTRRLDDLASDLTRNDGWFDGLPEGQIWVVPKRLHRPHDEPSKNDFVRVADRQLSATASGLDIQIRFTPSPEYAIVEALFLWKFGPILESLLSSNVLGYRLDLRQGRLNPTRRWLFEYWPTRYKQYRNSIINAALREVNAGNTALLLCADLTCFYDSIDPSFLLSAPFLNELEAKVETQFGELQNLTDYRSGVESLIRSYTRFRVRAARLTGLEWSTGIPIGALTSRIVGNLALCTLDRAIEAQETTRCYRRYVDDFAIVANVDHLDADNLDEIIRDYIPNMQTRDDSFQLDALALGRENSDFKIQRKKCKAYHISGVAGRNFLENVRRDFGRLVSEGRAFLDPTILLEDGLPSLVHAGQPGRPLTVLRDVDRQRLEHFELSIRHRSLERVSVLVDGESASQLASRALIEAVRFLKDTDDWVENVDVAFRMLRIGVRARDWNNVRQLLEYMDHLWGGTNDTRGTAGKIFHRGREVLTARAVVWMRNYLHTRRAESICSVVLPVDLGNLPELLRDGVMDGTRMVTWRALMGRARLLAAADLRTYDREDDRFNASDRDRGMRDADFGESDGDLRGRLRLIRRFGEICADIGDDPWRMSSSRLFLCTRPPSYFDVARRVLRRMEVNVPDGIFEELLELVNAIRGTQYADPVGERRDAHAVVIPRRPYGWEEAQGDPQLMLGNLPVSEDCYEGAATRLNGSVDGRPLLTIGRLADLNEVLDKAARRAGRYRSGASLMVLPELSLPRAWFREVATYVTRMGRFGLIVGLEYIHDSNEPWVLNQVYAVMPGPFLSAAVWPWRKHHPAREEERALRERGVSFPPVGIEGIGRRVVVVGPYGDMSVLICSELIESRRVADLLRRVEVVIVPAWNRDTSSYDHLIKSVGLQLFAIVGVANNGKYSDCRAWAPRETRWCRDLCRLIERDTNGVIAVPMPLGSLRAWREGGAAAVQEDGWRALPPDWS